MLLPHVELHGHLVGLRMIVPELSKLELPLDGDPPERGNLDPRQVVSNKEAVAERAHLLGVEADADPSPIKPHSKVDAELFTILTWDQHENGGVSLQAKIFVQAGRQYFTQSGRGTRNAKKPLKK